jgi:hypothetical protein
MLCCLCQLSKQGLVRVMSRYLPSQLTEEGKASCLEITLACGFNYTKEIA